MGLLDELKKLTKPYDDEDYLEEPNEWYFDDDPYDIVYYEFVNDED